MFKYISLFFLLSHCFEPITASFSSTTNHSSGHSIITKSDTEDNGLASQSVSIEMIKKEFQKPSSLLVYGYWRSAQEDGKLFLLKDIQKIILAYYEEYPPSEDAVLFWYNTLLVYEGPHLLPLLKLIVTHDLVEKRDLNTVLLEAVRDNQTEIVKILLEKSPSNIKFLIRALLLAKNDELKELIIEAIIIRIKKKLYQHYKPNKENYFYEDEFFIPKFIVCNKSIRLKIRENIRQGKAPFTDMVFSYEKASDGENAISLYMGMQGFYLGSYVEVTLSSGSKKIFGQLHSMFCSAFKNKDFLTLDKGTIRINLLDIREIRLDKKAEASASLKRDFNSCSISPLTSISF